jgi:hypothetical protein
VLGLLRLTTRRVCSIHVNNAGLGAVCGRAWLCERAMLAERNLAALGVAA